MRVTHFIDQQKHHDYTSFLFIEINTRFQSIFVYNLQILSTAASYFYKIIRHHVSQINQTTMIAEKYSQIPPPFAGVGKSQKYKMVRLIDEGSFGQVYEAHDRNNQSKRYAVKFQFPSKQPSLLHECTIYQHLHTSKPLNCFESYIPPVFYCAKEDQYTVLVMKLMSDSLKEIVQKSNKSQKIKQLLKIPMRTVLMLAEQMITGLEFIHERGVIHRDLKPANFCFGTENKQKLYLIDFGLAKKYMIDEKHINMQRVNSFVGNKIYGSIANHKCLQQSRKDDLQSLGYILIDLAKGTLPWKNFKSSLDPKKRVKAIGQLKESIGLPDLCEGLHLSFLRYMQVVRNLDFKQDPNYEFLRNVFRLAFLELGFEYQNELQFSFDSK